MHKDRLFELRDLLIEDANTPTGAKFDLGMWVAPSEPEGNPWERSFPPEVLGLPSRSELEVLPGGNDAIPQIAALPPMSCGTTGCALGLALISGRFEKYGLKGTYTLGTSGVNLYPSCNGEDGFEAGAELFAISNEDSRYLFDPDCYSGQTPKGAEGERLVAQRIDDFVNGIIERNLHPDTMDEDDSDAWDEEEEEEDDKDYDEDGNLRAGVDNNEA